MSENKKLRAAVVGYGNIGRYTIEALEAAPDFETLGSYAVIPQTFPTSYVPTVSSAASKSSKGSM